MSVFWYFAGLLTIPMLVLVAVAFHQVRHGSWVALSDCHDDMAAIPYLKWLPWNRCPVCGGLWVRSYVAVFVPGRAIREKQERDA